MPTPKKAMTIAVKNTNLNAGEYIKITNLTSGDTMRKAVDSNGEVAFNPANENLSWSSGDTILIESNGRIVFSTSTTLTSGGAKYTSSTSSADNSPVVSL